MKLKNKKTGEITEVYSIGYAKSVLDKYGYRIGLSWKYDDNLDQCKDYNSLADLTEEWEDYKEPKEHWMINSFGDVETVSSIYTDDMIDELREIGNYFETEEEVKKAVEKLKAFKRLKDLGAKFNDYNLGDLSGTDYIGDKYLIELDGLTNEKVCRVKSDLDLLFGGEE